jgi:hypothetical protein
MMGSFYTSIPGIGMLIVVALFLTAGFLVIRKIVNIEV